KSTVWKNYDIVVFSDKSPCGYVQCKSCKTLLKYDSKKMGSSSLQQHAVKGCSRPSSSSGAWPTQSYMTSFVQSEKKIPVPKKSEITDKCVTLCCKDIQPFETVSGKGFIELAQELINVGATYGRVSASSVLPHPSTISRRCCDIAEQKRKGLIPQINDILLSNVSVGMTTDIIWQGLAIMSHQTLNLKPVLVTTMFPLEEAKTSENVRHELLKLLVNTLGFDPSNLNKVVWVTDQGANIVLALRPYRHLNCQDHLLNTVLRHGLDSKELTCEVPDVEETIHNAKSLVKYMKQSSLAPQLPKTVIQMGETRFSTVYLTLNSIQEIYHELHKKLEEHRESYRLENIAPDMLQFLVSFLQPFYEAQRELEGDAYPTLNLVILWFEKLKRHCQPLSSDTPVQAAVRQRHYVWLLKKVEIHDLHKIALFLWPKFNQLRMLSNHEREEVYSEVRMLIKNFTGAEYQHLQSNIVIVDVNNDVSGPATAPTVAKKALTDFDEWENVHDDEGLLLHDEVQKYTQKVIMENERDLLNWWKEHNIVYPKLSMLARSVLCIPASSSSSKRNFSVAGRTIEQWRSVLKPSTINSILFLNDVL
uniref:BED-type domain-containing protein n=1 Tax=Latimeria chalumnae TaxID=7897 RepID=H3AQA6_LATCH